MKSETINNKLREFDKDKRTEDWLIHKCYTDGRVAQAIDAENARGKEAAE